MNALGIIVVGSSIGIAVVWLLTKLARTETADWRLTVLGLAAGAGLLAVAAGLAGTRRRRDRR